MKALVFLVASVWLIAADTPKPMSDAERLALAQKTIALQDAEITFQQHQMEGLKAQIANYEKALMQSAYKAQSEGKQQLDEIRRTHNAMGCDPNEDGSWKCPEQKEKPVPAKK